MGLLDGHQIDRVTEAVGSLFYEMCIPAPSGEDTQLSMRNVLHGYGGFLVKGFDEPPSLVLTKDQEIISRIMSCFGPFMVDHIDPLPAIGFKLNFARPMADIICDLNKILPISGGDTADMFTFSPGGSPEPATCHYDHTRIKDVQCCGVGREITVLFVVICTCCYTSMASGEMQLCEKEMVQKLTYRYHEYIKR